ncbi:uncharacterized protein LOC135222273 [Macrobrachium nipponense]|uniref:uncharacterized protein LOC135222273 n=1 Tax=Macrobrachium nipponense TaxID=159736 RepID=UPI0030C8B1F9
MKDVVIPGCHFPVLFPVFKGGKETQEGMFILDLEKAAAWIETISVERFPVSPSTMFPWVLGSNLQPAPLFFSVSHQIVIPDPLTMDFSYLNPIQIPTSAFNLFHYTTTGRPCQFDPSLAVSTYQPNALQVSNIHPNYATYILQIVGLSQAFVPNPGYELMKIRAALEANEERKLYFPAALKMNFTEKRDWAIRLTDAHRDFEVTFMEGVSRPFITVRGEAAVDFLTTEGFEEVVMDKIKQNFASNKIIVFDVPTHIDHMSLKFGKNIFWVKRRYVKRQPRPQLIVSLKGSIPDKFYVPTLGYRSIAVVTNLPLFCLGCSRWGHFKDECNEEAYRCRFCAGDHNSLECLAKIKMNIHIPPRCCNCGEEHNANSDKCRMRPHTTFKMITHPPADETIRNCESIAATADCAAAAAASALAIERDQIRIALLQKAMVEIEMLRLLVLELRNRNAFLLRNDIRRCSENGSGGAKGICPPGTNKKFL